MIMLVTVTVVVRMKVMTLMMGTIVVMGVMVVTLAKMMMTMQR